MTTETTPPTIDAATWTAMPKADQLRFMEIGGVVRQTEPQAPATAAVLAALGEVDPPLAENPDRDTAILLRRILKSVEPAGQLLTLQAILGALQEQNEILRGIRGPEYPRID